MSAMKKLTIIASQPDIVNVISELVYLSCFEPIEPIIELDPPDLTSLLIREEMDLEHYSANRESITVLASQYTYTIVGWVQAQNEEKIASMLSDFTCSYNFEDPSPEESFEVPTILKIPQLFGKKRSDGRNIFSPLGKNNSL